MSQEQNILDDMDKFVLSLLNLDKIYNFADTSDSDGDSKQRTVIHQQNPASPCQKTTSEVWAEIQDNRQQAFPHSQLALHGPILSTFGTTAFRQSPRSMIGANYVEQHTVRNNHNLVYQKVTGLSSAQFGCFLEVQAANRVRNGETGLGEDWNRMKQAIRKEKQVKARIRNIESAKRSRERKQAYLCQLKHEVAELTEENLDLKERVERAAELKPEDLQEQPKAHKMRRCGSW